MDIWKLLLTGSVTTVLAFVVGMLYMGLRRKITARVQNRVGPPIYQNFLDVMKLWSKKSSINHGFMQHVAPLWMIATSITTLMFIPILNNGSTFFTNLTFEGDLIMLLYLMVVGSLGMALGAGQTGNPNSAIGVTRGLTQMVGFEIPWVMALVALMIQHRTTTVAGLLDVQVQSGTWLMLSSPFAFIAALLAIPGMFRYSPFDIVGAPAELASGPISEFGGKYLGTMMTNGAIFAFVKLTLFVDIFMGGASNLGFLLLKTFALYMFPVLWGLVSPRFRTEQAVRFFWGWPVFFGVLGLIQAAI
ncbi:MAG: NADH-quinone oxidoreductase subunit H [Bacteroidales bacterium]|nr:NADH-quinone oxidoreductase subunit H [Bacteroidales bacterium]